MRRGNPNPHNRNPFGTKLVREFIAQHPDWPSRTIARALVEKHKTVWRDLETCRMSVLYHRGARQGRGIICKNPLPASPMSCNNAALPYVPPADEREWAPFTIATDKQCWSMVLSDIHFPYHDRRAIEAMLKEGKRRNVQKIILNGDQLDNHWQSKFDKDPTARAFVDELETAKSFLESLRESFGDDVEIVWKNGNHDERHEKYLAQHSMILFKLREVQLDALLELFALRVSYVTDKRVIHLGKLPLLHGHEYGETTFAPALPARGLYNKTGGVEAIGLPECWPPVGGPETRRIKALIGDAVIGCKDPQPPSDLRTDDSRSSARPAHPRNPSRTAPGQASLAPLSTS